MKKGKFHTLSGSAPHTLRFASLGLPPGGLFAAPRYPPAQPDTALNLAAVAAYARRLEQAGFSALFVADDTAVWAGSFEPLTLLSALTTLTERIGLVATVTTGFNEPFHVARRLASLDHLSGGRAGWNVDMSVVPWDIGGFVRDGQEERYRLAEEFLAVVRGLWDSYADNAIIADKRSGLYFRPGGRRALGHVGTHFRVAGPLNLSRPPQGHPVVFQSVASTTELAFAGRHADVVVAAAGSIDDACACRVRLDEACAAAGRTPGSVRVWQVLSPIGTPGQIADRIAEWHEAGAADGFAVRFPLIPGGADTFLDEVLPILARRGLFAPPEGVTLRDFLGLPRPERSVA